MTVSLIKWFRQNLRANERLIPKSEIVNIRYREKMEERKALLKSAKSDYAKAAAELDTLRAEVIKSLRGESAFSQDLLGSLISDCETKCLEVQRTMEAAQAAYDEGQAMLDALNTQYDDIISWADMYDSASMESKKMIVSCLIRRVEVYRDYRLHIDFNIDFEQFSAGLDISANRRIKNARFKREADIKTKKLSFFQRQAFIKNTQTSPDWWR